MARGRLILKVLSSSIKWNNLKDDYFTKHLYMLSYIHADDWGMIPGDARTIRSQVLPELPINSGNLQKIESSLKKLHDVGLITWYEYENHLIVYFTDFDKTQIEGIRRRTDKSRKWPPPKDLRDSSGKLPEIPGNSSLREGKGREQKGTEQKLKTDKNTLLSGDYPRLAKLFHELCLKNEPFPVDIFPEKNGYEIWVRDIRLLNTRDGHSIQEVERVMRWVTQDTRFWIKNARSPGSLRGKTQAGDRTKWEVIISQMEKDHGKGQGGVTHKYDGIGEVM